MSGPFLIWQRRDGQETRFPLVGEFLSVGRDEDVDLCVDEPLVSRLHARLERNGDGEWVVRDLGSTNLTKINGEVVRGEARLRDGDELTFGRARCVYRVRDEGAGPAVDSAIGTDPGESAGGNEDGTSDRSR